MTILTQDLKAWGEGFKAGKDGCPIQCPYPAGTREAWSWQGGQVEGDAANLTRETHYPAGVPVATGVQLISHRTETSSK